MTKGSTEVRFVDQMLSITAPYRMHFFNSFPLKTDFFCNFRIEFIVHNRKKTDESPQHSFIGYFN